MGKLFSWLSRKNRGRKESSHSGTDRRAESSFRESLYRPLDFSRKEIRLLELQYSEDNGAPISCKLIKASLDAAPPYEALSYVWGDATDTVPLGIGNQTLQITRNLDVALRHLRRPDVLDKGPSTSSHRRIWIDAICINQEDLQERSEQVRLMFLLYQKAGRVLIWLGEERDDSDMAMRLILRMQAEKLASIKRQVPDMVLAPYEQSQVDEFANEEPWYMSLMKLHQLSVRSDGEDEGRPDPPEWVAFHRLMQRPWWRRMWVVQELAAAEDRAIVGCGRQWIPWTPFVMASLAIGERKDHPFLQRLRRLAGDVNVISELAAICYRMDGRLNGVNGMILLLFYTKSKQATLPVDRVFALLGITPSVPMLPDYTKRPEEVYKTFAKLFVGSTQTLTILTFNRFPKKLHLPSWAPDFSCEYTGDECNITVPLGVYGADGHAGHNAGLPSPGCALHTSDAEHELTVIGTQFDRPVYVGRTWQGAPEERDSSLFDVLEEFERVVLELDRSRYRATDEELQQARRGVIWRTLVWNATPESRYPAPDTYGDFYHEILHSQHRLIDRFAPAADNFDPYQQPRIIPIGPSFTYYESLVKHSLNRRCFITSKGYLGSGPREMRHDDLVCILLGFKTPVILRRSAARHDRFEWVGPAYVHGIMHGEGIPQTAADGRTFTLI